MTELRFTFINSEDFKMNFKLCSLLLSAHVLLLEIGAMHLERTRLTQFS